MIQTALLSLVTASALTLSSGQPFDYAQDKPEMSGSAQLQSQFQVQQAQTEIGSASMSLNNRVPGTALNDIYKDNILLNMAYLSGTVKKGDAIDWNKVRQPFVTQFSLMPNQRFAYHDTLLAEYADGVILTTNSHFSADEGYKYSEGLYGMGVCHLASLINMAAKKAGLESIAPTNHDFYAINEVPKEYGVAIYTSPDAPEASAKENLYIKNTFDTPITVKFDFDGDNLKVSVLK